MANKVLSIEIGTNLTKICVVNISKNNVKVYQTMVFETPYDCVDDGYIKDKQVLADLIRQKLRENKILLKNVIFSVSSTKIANREVVIPLVKPDKIQNIIDANASEYFPIDIADYKIAYTILEKVNTKENKQYRLLVLAAHNNLLTTYYELASELNLHVMFIDYTGNSIYQVLRKQIPEGIHMVVQINASNSLINVLKDGRLELQRTIPYGYMTLIDTIMGNPYLQVDHERNALELLRDKRYINPHLGKTDHMIQEDVKESSDSSEQIDEDVREEITESLNYLISNILRISDYYINRHPDSRIQTIYVMGLGSRLQGMEQLLTNELGSAIQIIVKIDCASFSKENIDGNLAQSDYIACIGAVINPTGLIPKQYSQKAQIKNDIKAVVTITSLAIVTSILLAGLSVYALNEANSENKKITKEIKQIKSIDDIYSRFINSKQDLDSIEKVDQSCVNKTGNYIKLFDEMEQKLPKDATVHSFKGSEKEIMIDFTADSYDVAAMVMKQLKTIDLITNVSTSAVTKQTDEQGNTTVSFSVSAAYKDSVQEQGEAK